MPCCGMARSGQGPDSADLQQAALAHLARYATTRATARAIVGRLAESGLVNDAAFAEARARRLARSGSSRRSITAHLLRHGVGGTDLAAALPDDPAAELTAALALARKRHIGPFRASGPPEADARRRELAALARAGYPAAIARRALAMPRAEAETRLLGGRQGTD